jgi:GAF domain-containing protein
MSYAGLALLDDLASRLEAMPVLPEVFAWLVDHVPHALLYPEDCVIAIEYRDQTYGSTGAADRGSCLSEAMQGTNGPSGLLRVAYVRPHEFGAGERQLVRAIAHRVGAYIEVRALIDQAQVRAAESDVLYQLGRSLSTRLRMGQVLDEIHRGVSALVDASSFYIGFYDQERNEVTFPLNVSESVIDRHISVLSADEGLTGYVLRTGQSLLIEQDVAGWLDAHGIEPIGELAACWLGVPLLVGDRVQGILAVQDYRTARAFTEADREMLVAIAGQAAIAIQNARLFEELETRARHEQALRAITAGIRSTTDPETILRTAARELGTALGRRTFARLGDTGEFAARSAERRSEGEA